MNWKKNSKSLENQEAGKGNVDTEERREIAVLEADPGCGWVLRRSLAVRKR